MTLIKGVFLGIMHHQKPTCQKAMDNTSKPTKVRRQKSQEDQLADQFLKTQTAPYRTHLLLAWGLELGSVLLLIVQMGALAQFFAQLLTAQAKHSLTSVLAYQAFWHYLPVIALCLLVRPVLQFFKEKILADTGRLMAQTVRQMVLSVLGGLHLARSAFGADGAIAGFVTETPDELIGYAKFSVQKMTAISTPIIIAVVIGFWHWSAALLLFATVPLMLIFMAIIGIKTAQKSRQQMEALALLGGSFLDWIRGVGTLKRLSAVELAHHDMANSANQYKERTMSVLKIAFLNSTVLELLSALSIAVVAVYLGFGLMGMLSFAKGVALVDYGTALFILLLVPEFYAPLRRLGAEYHAKGQATAAAKLLAPILASTLAKALPISDTYQIYVQDLSVRAGERTRLSLASLMVKTGQKVAIVGRSGSGKSTLFQVLLGVCAFEGVAKLGVGKIGYLPQIPSLLPISIADNLRLAKPSASDDELNEVLHKVGLAKLIIALPKGIDTQLTERGGGLSGGQAQRLAIAQLLLQDARVWLLDEPTEHLDGDSKLQIHDLLHALSGDKTILWATHDTPVAWVDMVVDLDKVA